MLRQLGDARGGSRAERRARRGRWAYVHHRLRPQPRRSFLDPQARRRRLGERALPPRLTAGAAADWPRTTRVLPWSIAALIAMIWLTPFDRIQLAGTAPVNITLDRILLPLVAVIWLIAFTAGPGAAPRLRFTRVHAAAAFLAVGFLSVVLDAHYLSQPALCVAVKKLALLVSYMAIFLIVSSSVRRTEVPAFLTYTLALAVIAALGAIYEYRFHQNLFTSLQRTCSRVP